MSLLTNCRILVGVTIGIALSATHSSHAATSPDYVMDVQMVPAVCSLHPDYAKKRKCLEGYSLNISGLFPETTSDDCTTTSSAKLPPLQAKVVARVMPDEKARILLWRNIGGCIPMNATQYFRTIINYADRLKVPHELTEQGTVVLSMDSLRNKFLKINPKLNTHAIRFNCHKTREGSLLTAVKVCFKNNGQYKQCPTNIVNTCPKNVTIKGTY